MIHFLFTGYMFALVLIGVGAIQWARQLMDDHERVDYRHPVQSSDAKGGFVRQTSSFRNWVTPDGSPGPTGEGGCPPTVRPRCAR